MRLSIFIFICIFVVLTVFTSFFMASAAEIPPLPYDADVAQYMIVADTLGAEEGDPYKYYLYGTTFQLFAMPHEQEPEQIMLVKNYNLDLFNFKSWRLENGEWLYLGEYATDWISASMDVNIVSNTYDIRFIGSGNIYKMATTPAPTPIPTETPNDLMQKNFTDYSVTEGLLLILVLIMLVVLISKVFRG